MKNDDIIIYCPLAEENITAVECMEVGAVKVEYLDAKFRRKENASDICQKCKYHDY